MMDGRADGLYLLVRSSHLDQLVVTMLENRYVYVSLTLT